MACALVSVDVERDASKASRPVSKFETGRGSLFEWLSPTIACTPLFLAGSIFGGGVLAASWHS